MRSATDERLERELPGLLAVVLLLAFVIAFPTPAGAAEGARRLAAPFDVAQQRAMWGRDVASLGACKSPPEPVRDLIRDVYYSDAANSIRKPDEYRKTLTSMAPLWAYSGALNAMADDFVVARAPDPARARCVLAWLDAWATAGAMQGETSTWAHYDKLWGTGVGAAMAYLKIKDAPGLDEMQRRRVVAWLVGIAQTTIKENERYNAWRDQRKLGRSSLSYWTAAYVMLAGIAANDRALFYWSLAVVRLGLSGVREDGAMGPELERKGRAFVYHVWSLEPLSLVAAGAAANGVDLAGEHYGALRRVVRFMLAMRAAPEQFTALAGIEQQHDSNPAKWPTKDSAAALEIINRLRPDPEITKLLAPLRPVSTKFSGGNFTVLFAVK